MPDSLLAALAGPGVGVLQAPPGWGKTTLVPPALLDESWLAGQRILLLEPRRLAARAAAARIADLAGETVGGPTAGYQVRLDRRIGPDTRIEVLTEGILTRRLQSDPGLDGVGLVIFDEFHERSVHADLGLALALDVRSGLREDLRLLVMSATIDGTVVAALLEDAPVVELGGSSYPVEDRYLAGTEPEDAVALALAETDGDVLVFLPGEREIRRAARRLDRLGAGLVVRPLYGALSPADQDLAVRPDTAGRRKIVLATTIAETSLTIDGVRTVVDAGLARVPRYEPATGMTRLITVRVSRSSADQRRGRAGRQAPGVCYRLWSQGERLAAHQRPEILDTDLASLTLELAAWGVTDPAELRWLDPPPAPAMTEARDLLVGLGALDGNGRITATGRRLVDQPRHPRLAHLVLRGAELGFAPTARTVAALLDEPDVLVGPADRRARDLTIRVDTLRGDAPPFGTSLRRGARHRVAQLAGGNATLRAADRDLVGASVALAYPDRIAARRSDQRGEFLLANGRAVSVPAEDSLADEEFIAVAEASGDRENGRIRTAAPIDRAEIETLFADRLERRRRVEWDRQRRDVIAVEERRLGAIVLSSGPVPDPAAGALSAALVEGVRSLGIDALGWSGRAVALRQRVRFLRAQLGDRWPDLSDQALIDDLTTWLGPHLVGCRRWADVERIDLSVVLSSLLGWNDGADLERLAPTRVVVPSGSRMRLRYEDPQQGPVLAVRIQELFGLSATPTVLDGRVPVVLRLLSPAQRPVQITDDLAGFWAGSYSEVRKEMRGRYPKHHWPEDPTQIGPSRRPGGRHE